MSLIGRMLKRARLPPEQRLRIDAWRAMAEPDLGGPASLLRFVAVDVESSGLDVFNDRLIAIGAVEIAGMRLVYGHSFHSVLRQGRPSSDENILVHGIGGSEQARGDDPAEALLRFLEFIGKSPLVGYHAPFDEIMIRKATRAHLGEDFRRIWLDLAWLAPAIFAERGNRRRNLDDWMADFNVFNASRHDALADALATGQVFQVLEQRAAAKGIRSARDLVETARSQEWLARRRQ